MEGNKALKSEDLLKGLEGAGIAEGQVYKRSTLEGMKSELVRQYASQGRYGASVEIETIDKPRIKAVPNPMDSISEKKS